MRLWWGEAPERSNRSSEAIGTACHGVWLDLKSRRAVFYRGPWLGASIGLAYSSLGVRTMYHWSIAGLCGSLAPPKALPPLLAPSR